MRLRLKPSNIYFLLNKKREIKFNKVVINKIKNRPKINLTIKAFLNFQSFFHASINVFSQKEANSFNCSVIFELIFSVWTQTNHAEWSQCNVVLLFIATDVNIEIAAYQEKVLKQKMFKVVAQNRENRSSYQVTIVSIGNLSSRVWLEVNDARIWNQTTKRDAGCAELKS